jgi:SAM-dependent methyltransferase
MVIFEIKNGIRMSNAWDDRYSDPQYVYGKEPNQFFRKELSGIAPGTILLPGEGEGRNAVFAASLGWKVDAVDFSEEGRKKAEKLAKESGVEINYRVVDFANYFPEENFYDAVGIFFIHLEEELRSALFEKIIKSLKPSGKIIFECFENDQIKFSSGGPKDPSLLYSLEDVVNLFIDLDFQKLSKEKTLLNEGPGHSGEGMVIQFIGSRP